MSDQFTPRATLLSMSGLDFLLGVRDGDLPPTPVGIAMGFTIHDIEEGRVSFKGAPSNDFTNPMGTVHGGWYGAILDSALGCAVMTTVPQGSVYTTLEFKINITRALPIGTEVIADATVQHDGRSTGVASATLVGAEDGQLYATGSTTCIIMKVE